nr:unnamed protein product [Callosobruchus chinensis]
MKLVTLLALITGHRLQTLTSIRLQNIVRFPDRLEIRISDRIKTSSSKSLQPYLRPSDIDYLILTVKRPIRQVSSQRLSKWIKQTLAASGIDTTLFSGYSTRHAATSAAFRAGISSEIIRSMAGWTQKSNMFARFYNRPLANDPTLFAKGILSTMDPTCI